MREIIFKKQFEKDVERIKRTGRPMNRLIDTNILLYAISTQPAEATKAATAQAILSNRDLALSVQVLQEF